MSKNKKILPKYIVPKCGAEVSVKKIVIWVIAWVSSTKWYAIVNKYFF